MHMSVCRYVHVSAVVQRPEGSFEPFGPGTIGVCKPPDPAVGPLQITEPSL